MHSADGVGGGQAGVRLLPGGGAGQRGQHRGEQPRGERGENIYSQYSISLPVIYRAICAGGAGGRRGEHVARRPRHRRRGELRLERRQQLELRQLAGESPQQRGRGRQPGAGLTQQTVQTSAADDYWVSQSVFTITEMAHVGTGPCVANVRTNQRPRLSA